jgi:hypothetical protein
LGAENGFSSQIRSPEARQLAEDMKLDKRATVEVAINSTEVIAKK